MKRMVCGFAALAALGMCFGSGCGDDTSEPNNSVSNNSAPNNSNNSVSNNSASNNSASNNSGTKGPTWNNGVADIFKERCSRCHMWTLDYALVTVETEHLRYKIELGHGDLTEEEMVDVGVWFDNNTPLK